MKLRSILTAVAPLLLIAAGLPARAEPRDGASPFTPNGQEILDTRTNLIWTRCPIGMKWMRGMCVEHVQRFLHSEAVSFVQQTQGATHAGWRLPTREEFKALVSADGRQLLDQDLFSDLTDSECNYWSSTPFKAHDGSSTSFYYMGDFAFDGSTKNNEYAGSDEEHSYGCLMLLRSK